MKIKTVLFFLFGIYFLPNFSFTQGALLNEEIYDDSKLLKGGTRAIGEKDILKKYCPTPTDQGNNYSCVGCAIAHAVTIQRAYQCDIVDPEQIDKIVHSASFIYNSNKIGEDCRSGAFFSDCLSFSKKQGICLEKTFPNDLYQCIPVPSDEHFDEAAKFKIKWYEKLFERNASSDVKCNSTMIYLDWNNPIIIGVPIPKNFRKKKDFQVSDWAKVSERSKNLHAMVVVDYNEEKREFLLMNSYGVDWGKGGFIRIGFDDFGRLSRCAYLISIGKIKC